ncbi:hypothetical protein [Niabella sp.]|uniref:hypothetical protein n=1 Tax=Niabella sp. TaxID=1962976 RepID=UPI00260DB817|nr:hypothetical protein [Niabella sp.]
MYEKPGSKDDISLAAGAGTEKKTCEIKELLPEEALIANSGFQLLQLRGLSAKMFAGFRKSHVQTPYTPVPTPPPRTAA